MTMNRNVNKFHTTIGELIVALSDAAFEVCAEKRVAYLLVTLAVSGCICGSLVVARSPVAAPTLHLLKLRFRDAKEFAHHIS